MLPGRIPVDLSGQKFTRWTVLKRVNLEVRGSAQWLCQCDCGTIRVVLAPRLKSGKSKSCGCLHREIAAKDKTTHGQYQTPEYQTWHNIKDRCYNPRSTYFKHYGGRGITMCDEWRNDFEAFRRDMGPRPEGTTIERKNNALGYCQTNCKWATRKQQAQNRRPNHMLTIDGITMCVTEWAEEKGIHPATLFYRLSQGWSPEKSVNTKVSR